MLHVRWPRSKATLFRKTSVSGLRTYPLVARGRRFFRALLQKILGRYGSSVGYPSESQDTRPLPASRTGSRCRARETGGSCRPTDCLLGPGRRSRRSLFMDYGDVEPGRVSLGLHRLYEASDVV